MPLVLFPTFLPWFPAEQLLGLALALPLPLTLHARIAPWVLRLAGWPSIGGGFGWLLRRCWPFGSRLLRPLWGLRRLCWWRGFLGR